MISALVLLTLGVAPDAPLPVAISTALAKQWPAARVLKVEPEPNGAFEVELTDATGRFELKFDSSGKLLGEERVVALSETPPAVQKRIASWKGWAVERIERVTEGSVTTYEIVAKQHKGVPMEITLSAAGLELRRQAATE